MKNVFHEITPLESDKIIFAKNTLNDKLDFPIHYHKEFELTLAHNTTGNKLIGECIENFSDIDLTLIGPDVVHCYRGKEGFLSVIQFSDQLINYPVFNKDEFVPVKNLLIKASKGGIVFSKKVAVEVANIIMDVPNSKGVERVINFLKILNILAHDNEQRLMLSSYSETDINKDFLLGKNETVNQILSYIDKNYSSNISLDDIAKSVCMTPSSLSRMFKRKTGRNIWDLLLEYRINKVKKLLIETDLSISEIAFDCGFNNLSNFNRVFQNKVDGLTPKKYRDKVGKIVDLKK